MRCLERCLVIPSVVELHQAAYDTQRNKHSNPHNVRSASKQQPSAVNQECLPTKPCALGCETSSNMNTTNECRSCERRDVSRYPTRSQAVLLKNHIQAHFVVLPVNVLVSRERSSLVQLSVLSPVHYPPSLCLSLHIHFLFFSSTSLQSKLPQPAPRLAATLDLLVLYLVLGAHLVPLPWPAWQVRLPFSSATQCETWKEAAGWEAGEV